MNSFTLTAVGNLARNPEAVAKGDITYTRFLLVGNDYAGKDDEGAPREIVTSLWFVAFGGLAESLARSARKGDQLIIEARVRASNRTDKQGEKQYDHDFVVQGFRFGAPGKIKREERDARRDDGAHREDRSNGRAHGGVATVSDGDSGAANGSTVSAAAAARGPRGVSGTNSPVGANSADGSKGASAGKGANGGGGANNDVSANADNSGNGGGATPGGEANGANGVTGNAGANGSAAAASEKPAASSRGGRRAASAPP